MEAVDGDSITVVGGYVAAIIHALEARGITMARILEAGGLARFPATIRWRACPLTSVRRLLAAAVELTGDPYIGLYAANFLHAAEFPRARLRADREWHSLREFCERLGALLPAADGQRRRPRLVVHAVR